MMKLPKQRYLVALMCAAGLGSWAAPTLADVQYKFSGFGTLGATKTNTDETEFRTSVEQFRGAGKTVDFGVDSKLAAQGSAVFSNGVTLTGQVLGARKGDEDFDMAFEWLYAQYTGLEGLDLKGGRVVLPAFLVSDSRLVGYATPWLRVSPLVYAMMPMSNVDGAQATYRRSIGPAVVSVQATRGSSTGSSSAVTQIGPYVAPAVTHSETSKILGLNATLEWGDWTVRVSQIKDNTKLGVAVTTPTPMVVGLGYPSVLNSEQNFKDKFTEYGLQYDDGSLVVMAEHVSRSTKESKVQDAKAWYVAAGYRFGSVMPYAMISQYKMSFKLNTPTLPPKATGHAVGVRYDFSPSMALKGEWAQYKNNSGYAFTDELSATVANKKINVMSVALDFVF